MNHVKKFMLDRYGVDQLNLMLLLSALLITVMAVTFSSNLLFVLCWFPLVVYVYRTFSKDLIKRYRENTAFLRIINPFMHLVYVKSGQAKDHSHKYIKCPCCSQTISVDKTGKKDSITCPICNSSLVKRQ